MKPLLIDERENPGFGLWESPAIVGSLSLSLMVMGWIRLDWGLVIHSCPYLTLILNQVFFLILCLFLFHSLNRLPF